MDCYDLKRMDLLHVLPSKKIQTYPKNMPKNTVLGVVGVRVRVSVC